MQEETAAHAFAVAYRHRLAAGGGGGGAGGGGLAGEAGGACAVGAGPGRARGAVRALTPTEGTTGYAPGVSVLETNVEDLPFLLDSVSAEIRARGFGLRRVVHPIVGVERNGDGSISRITHPREGTRESVM